MGAVFAVAVGGGLGSLARYYIAGWLQPAGTLFKLGHLCRQHHRRDS